MQASGTERGTPANVVERWCADYSARLIHWLARRVMNQALVQDAVQELWLGLLRRAPPRETTDAPQQLSAWLHVALLRRAADLVRRDRLRAHQPLGEVGSTTDELALRAEFGERAELVRFVLTHLTANGSAPAARLLELRFFKELSVTTIGRLLSVSPRVVTARLQRAKRKFRAVWIAAGGNTD